mgnify:CR=1 FL=1
MIDSTQETPSFEITSLNVAEVRKALNYIRKAWENNDVATPLLPSSEIVPGLTISRFCFHFVLGHHTKRHNKVYKKDLTSTQGEDA